MLLSWLIISILITSYSTIRNVEFVEANTESMRSDNSDIFYEKRGNGKQKMLLIHGYGATRMSFYDIAPFLENQYELYLIDLIGFGDSRAPFGWEYKPQNQAEAVYRFIKKNELTDITVVGHSYGGMVVLLLLQKIEKAKEYFLIRNAVLIDPAAYPQRFPFFVQIPKIPIVNTIFLSLIPARKQAQYTLKRLFYDDKKVTDERIERYASYYRKGTHRKAIIESAKNMIPKNIDQLEEDIKTISIRTLIIWGSKDPVIPKSNIDRLHKELKNSNLMVIEDAGHIPHEEKPEETYNAFIEFIRD